MKIFIKKKSVKRIWCQVASSLGIIFFLAANKSEKEWCGGVGCVRSHARVVSGFPYAPRDVNIGSELRIVDRLAAEGTSIGRGEVPSGLEGSECTYSPSTK